MTATAAMPAPRAGALELAQTVRRGLARVPLSAIELAMRVGVGMVFWKSSMLKLGGWDSTVALFANEYRLPVLPPELAAVMGTATELTGSGLLFVGPRTPFGPPPPPGPPLRRARHPLRRRGAARPDADHPAAGLPRELARPPALGLDPGLRADPRRRPALGRPPDRAPARPRLSRTRPEDRPCPRP